MIKVKCSEELKDRRALETAESGEPLFGYILYAALDKTFSFDLLETV
jgi:hypothetical protein